MTREPVGRNWLAAGIPALLLLWQPQGAMAADIVGAVPQRYIVDVAWTPSTRLLSGTSAITIKNVGPSALSRVWVRLWPNSIAPLGTSCTNARARITRVAGGTVGEYRTGCSAVAIDLPQALGTGGQATFTLTFRETVPTAEGGFGRDLGVDFLGNALPVVAVRDERGLHLEDYPEYGEAEYHLVADWRTTVRVPDTLSVAMTGLESATSSSGSKMFTATSRTRDFAFVIGRLQSRSTVVDGVRLRVVGGKQVSGKLDAALRRLKNAYETYQELYGGYPLADLDVIVGDYSFGGTEYPGLVLSDPDLATIAHEVAHQWFYSLVGNDQYNDPWLDESFAVWNEVQFDDNGFKCDTDDPLDGSSRGLATGMNYWGPRADEYDDVIYRGGACALIKLEEDIGRRNFLTVLRNHVADRYNGIARTADFLDEVRRVAPWYDVDAWAELVGLD